MAGALEVIQVVAEMALLGQQILNVFEFVATDPLTDEENMLDLRMFLENEVYINLVGNMDSELTFEQLYFRNLTDNTFMGQIPWDTMVVGLSAADALPLGTAQLITLPTAFPKVRGRKFFGGLTEAINGNGVFIPAWITNVLATASALSSGFIGEETSVPYAPGVLRTTGGFAPFIEALVSNVPSYQRRRKQGVGS